jgi:ADP-heptose:LPS heptosyltransferase
MQDNSAQKRQTATSPPSWNVVRSHRSYVAACCRRLLVTTARQLCLPGQLPCCGIHRILVCCPGQRLENALLIGPLLAEIEALYPCAQIDIVGGGNACAQLFAGRFRVRRTYSLLRMVTRHPWATTKLLRQLRRDTYDLAVDPGIDPQSGQLLLALAKARFKLGYPNDRGPAAAAWHELHPPEHLAQRGVFLLRAAYAGKVSRPCPLFSLQLSNVEMSRAREALEAIVGGTESSCRPRMVIGIFTDPTGANRYRSDWWEQFIDKLVAELPDVCVVDLVVEHGESPLDGRLTCYCTRDPRQLAAMISCLDAFIGNHCGVMHLAAATGTPTMGFFSTTSRAKCGPYGHQHESIETGNLCAADVATIAADWLKLTAPRNRGIGGTS